MCPQTRNPIFYIFYPILFFLFEQSLLFFPSGNRLANLLRYRIQVIFRISGNDFHSRDSIFQVCRDFHGSLLNCQSRSPDLSRMCDASISPFLSSQIKGYAKSIILDSLQGFLSGCLILEDAFNRKIFQGC